MKRKTMMMGATLALLVGVAGSAAADDGRWKVTKPQVITDTFTDTQWTQRDNLGDINWHDAKAHCANLKLDGGGWRLPTMNELSQLYSGAQGNKVACGAYQCSAPKAFYLTGTWFWSGEQGNSSSEAWDFHLTDGSRISGHVSYAAGTRALCVRRSS